jgi:hypothetical protein
MLSTQAAVFHSCASRNFTNTFPLDFAAQRISVAGFETQVEA